MARNHNIDFGKVRARLEEAVEGFAGREAKVGWFPGAKYEDGEGGKSVAHIAAIQEFGYPGLKIPPRLPMRATIAEHKQEWIALMAQGASAAARGDMTADEVLDGVGQQVAGDLKKEVARVRTPALSPITLMLRKMKDEHKGDADWHVTGKTVAEAAARVAAGEPGSERTTPLNDSGLLISSIMHLVGDVGSDS